MLPTRAPGAEPVPLTVAQQSVGEVAVLHCAGDLDVAGLEPVAVAVAETLATRPTGLVLDLSRVGFCDTVGLRLLLTTAARARAQGCALALAGPRPAVRDFLARVCADRTLPAYPHVASAIEALMFSVDWR